MVNEREQIRKQASEIVGGRIVRWTDGRTCPMYYEGWEWTLEFFDVPKSEQRELHRLLWHHLYERVWEQFGRGLVFIFHTPEDTNRLYPWVRREEAGASHPPQPVR